jgi:hypothetical protein
MQGHMVDLVQRSSVMADDFVDQKCRKRDFTNLIRAQCTSHTVPLARVQIGSAAASSRSLEAPTFKHYTLLFIVACTLASPIVQAVHTHNYGQPTNASAPPPSRSS